MSRSIPSPIKGTTLHGMSLGEFDDAAGDGIGWRDIGVVSARVARVKVEDVRFERGLQVAFEVIQPDD